MASHGKVLDLFDDRYLELQDVVGNVEPLPTLVPYEQYKQHAITYRMDTNHDIFMALLQDFTERRSLETGKELWTWCLQWKVDETAARQPIAAPHSPKKPRLDLSQPSTPAQPPSSRRGAPPITAQVRKIDPELLHQEDMLRILVDIVQVNSTVVPNFIEFLYRWIDFYEGDGKALNAALYGEIPSLWDFEYHPVLVPEEVKKRLDEANAITRDGKNDGARGGLPRYTNAQELTQNSPTKTMRQKPDLAVLERKAEESERLQYREVRFGIQPPKLNEPLPPLINVPRDRVKRAKYHVACFKSRQRAFYLLMEAGVTPQQLKDYSRCQTMSLRDTPPLEGAGGLKNYERDAKLAQLIDSAKEKYRAKQMEIAISNKLADEAQLAGRSTILAGSPGAPLIPVMSSNINRPDMAGQMFCKIQQTRDQREQRISIVPTPLIGNMKSRLFHGARDRAALLEMFDRGGKLPKPRFPPDVDGGGPRNGDDSDGSTNEDPDDDTSISRGDMRIIPRPSLPPPATLSRPTLPPPPRPPPAMMSTQPRGSFFPSIAQSSQQQFQPDHGGPHASNMTQRTSNPPEIIGLASYPRPPVLAAPRPPVLAAPRPPNITVSSPQFSAQHPPPIVFGGGFFLYRARTSPLSPPPGLEHDDPFLSGDMPSHAGPPPSMYPSTQLSSTTYPSNLAPPSYPVGPGFSTPAPPPGFAQRLLAQGHAARFYQGLQNAGPPLLRIPDQPDFASPSDQIRSAQEHQQGFGIPSALSPFPSHPRGGIQRTASSALRLRPPASPLSSLAPSLLATSPFDTSHGGIPVQIYLPRILIPSNTIGPGGMKLGNNGCAETDAFLLGHTHPLSGKITFSRAVFLPLDVWTNAQDRVRKGKYKVLESYIAPTRGTSVPHRAVYEKVKQAYGMMKTGSPAARERELTKRWRTSRGQMKETERGAVWEGWAVDIDREIAMSKEERTGAFVQDPLIDGIDEDSEEVRRRKEIDELLETDEAWDYDEDEDVHMQG